MNILITGASSGLGLEIAKEFWEVRALIDCKVYGLARELPPEDFRFVFCKFFICDVRSRSSITDCLIEYGDKDLDVLINNAGVNYIDWMDKIGEGDFETVIDTNVKGIWRVSSIFLDNLRTSRGGTILNVISNAYRVPMTHSIAYNASKGAAAIMTRQMARELQKEYGICVFGICPNKLEGTKMSKEIEKRVCEIRGWSENVAFEYQKAALLAGFETKPRWVAELVVWLLSKPHRHKYLTGCLLELGY